MIKNIFLLFLVVIFTLNSCSEHEKKSNKEIITQNLVSVEKNSSHDSISKIQRTNPFTQKKENTNSYEESLQLKNYLIDKIPSRDFHTITENTVIFTHPDSKQIKKFKKEIGEEDFYIVADDNSWYQFQAGEYFEKKKMTILYPEKRYLKFITHDKKVYNFDTKAKFSGWQTILFRPDSLPKIVNPVGIEQEDSLYFGK